MKKVEKLRNLMYAMFLDGCLPDLDMEDFQVMWEAIMLRWQIKIDYEDWEAFIIDINFKSSDNKEKFNEVFDKHFLG